MKVWNAQSAGVLGIEVGEVGHHEPHCPKASGTQGYERHAGIIRQKAAPADENQRVRGVRNGCDFGSTNVIVAPGCCRSPVLGLSAWATRPPFEQKQLLRALLREVAVTALHASDDFAEARMAAFLVDISNRYAMRGYSGTKFRLQISCADLGWHLRLAPGTARRTLRRFCKGKILAIGRHEIELLDLPRLRALARGLLNL